MRWRAPHGLQDPSPRPMTAPDSAAGTGVAGEGALTRPPPAVHRSLLQQARREVQGGSQAGLPEAHLQVAHLWLSLLRGEGTLWVASERGGRG